MSSGKFELLKNITKKIGSGATPTGGRSSYKLDGISLIRSQNVLDMSFSKEGLAFIDEVQASKLENVSVEENDILLNITGDSIARVCKVPKEILPARVNQHVSIIRANSAIDPDYLLYYLIFRKEFLLTISRVGGTRNALTKEAVENIEIRYVENSRDIASVLSALDDKIELNNRINVELEAMAKLIYEYWFVQFDFPDIEGKPYKSSGGKMVWDKELKREIPEGWQVKKLKSISSFISRGISPKYLESGGVCVLNQKCIRDQKVNFEFSRRHDDLRKDPSSRLIEKLDILVNSTGVGTLGRVGIVKWLPEDTITFDSHVTVVRAETDKMNSYFFGFSLLQKQAEIESFSLGSTGQVELSKSQLEDIKLIKPPKELQASFEEIYSNVIEKTSNNEQQNQELASLRDWLLPMLMNGQVAVADAEEMVEEKLGLVADGEREKYRVK